MNVRCYCEWKWWTFIHSSQCGTKWKRHHKLVFFFSPSQPEPNKWQQERRRRRRSRSRRRRRRRIRWEEKDCQEESTTHLPKSELEHHGMCWWWWCWWLMHTRACCNFFIFGSLECFATSNTCVVVVVCCQAFVFGCC